MYINHTVNSTQLHPLADPQGTVRNPSDSSFAAFSTVSRRRTLRMLRVRSHSVSVAGAKRFLRCRRVREMSVASWKARKGTSLESFK